jgi:hypothetical protein
MQSYEECMRKLRIPGRITPFRSCFFLAGYLATLSVSTLYSVDDKTINECGAVGGMRTVVGEFNVDCKGPIK